MCTRLPDRPAAVPVPVPVPVTGTRPVPEVYRVMKEECKYCGTPHAGSSMRSKALNVYDSERGYSSRLQARTRDHASTIFLVISTGKGP